MYELFDIDSRWCWSNLPTNKSNGLLNDSGRSYTNTHEIAAGLELSKTEYYRKNKTYCSQILRL